MKVQYRITEDDYANAARFHAWRHFIARPSAVQFVIGGILLIVIGYGLLTFPGAAAMLALSFAVFSVIYVVFLFVTIPNRARRHYRQYKGLEEPITAELTEAGITFSNSDGEGILRWSNIHQWRQNSRFILVYAMPILYYMLPKSIERDGFDIQQLVQELAKRVGPER